MDKRLSILFIFLLLFQTASNGLLVPVQTKAEGNEKSIFTNMLITDEDGHEVDVKEADEDSIVHVKIDWSIEGKDITSGDTESRKLPTSLVIETEQHGELKAGDTKIGEYRTAGNTVTVSFNEAAEKHEDAKGTFEVEVVVANDNQEDEKEKQAEEEADTLTTTEDTKELEDSETTAKEGATEKESTSSDEEVVEEGNAQEEDITTSDASEIETFEGKDLGNIFTFDSFTLNGEEIEDGAIIEIKDGTVVQLKYVWDTEGLDAKADDTASIQLPDIFKQINITNQPIITDGVNVGEYSIIDGELRFVFNENVEDGAVQNGLVGLNLQFNLEKFQENIVQEIHFNDKSDKTLTVIAKPAKDISRISKEGHPDRDLNAREIIWTIDVMNDNAEPITDATLKDILPEGLGEPRDFIVNELSVGINGDKHLGNTVNIEPQVDGNEFHIEFENIEPFKGYRIQYTTSIEDYTIDSFTNDALFTYEGAKLPAEATVDGFERSNPIKKSGVYNNKTGQIDWTIVVNESGGEIDEAIVEDNLPDELSLVEGSIKIHKFNSNWNWIEERSAEKFPINLGQVGSDTIYQITFSTNIDWSKVNDGDYQLDNEFTNHTELYDGEMKIGEDDAKVEYSRQSLLEKSGTSNVDYDNKTLTWTIDVNKAKHPVNNVVVTDLIPEGLSISKDDILIKDEEGNEITAESITISDADDGKQKVRIDLGNIGDKHIKITYTTEIEDFKIDNFDNAAFMEGDGIGEGTPGDNHEITPPANSFAKKFSGIDYNEKTIDWNLTVNPIRENIAELKIVDTFPNKGLILLPETLKVTIGNQTLKEGIDYTLSPNTEGEETGYHKGFILEFTGDSLPLNAQVNITYKTSYDPQLEVEGHNPDPHIGEENQARIYKNQATFIGKTVNNNDFTVERDAQTTVREDSWNSGKKEGQRVRKDSKGNIVNGWESGSERKIAWQLYTNYQKQNLGSGVVITDTLAYEGTIDPDSIKVSVYEVAANGETNITGPEIDDYTVTVEGDEFTLTFNDNFEVKERYVIEFTTTVPNISQPKYTNNATVKVGEDEYSYSGTVNYDKHNRFLEKGTIGLDSNQVFTGEEIDWQVTVNEGLSTILRDVIITDTISPGLVFVEDSLKIKKLSGSTLVEDEDYSHKVTVNENDETILEIKLLDDLEETLVLNYTVVVTETDGEVNNTVSFKGTGIDEKTVESERISAREFSWVGGEFNPKRGAIVVTKVDSEEEEVIANNEATFILEFDLNGERVQFGDEFTTENGVLEIGNLPLRTYYLIEVESPNGYVLSDEEMEINVDEPYGKNEKVFEVDFKNTKEKADITGTKIWKGGESIRPDSIQLQLYRDGEAYGEPVTLEDGETKYTWTDLDVTDIDGKVYDYTVDEVQVPDNFEKTISEDGLTVTNEYKIEQVTVSVNKEWIDANNQDGLRPESITVKLLANNEETDLGLTLSAENGWEGAFTELPATDRAGNEITYTIEEVAVKGYESEVEVNEDNPYDFKLTNTHAPVLINVEGTKKWDDADNQDGKRPETITVNLLANGKQIDSVEVTEEDNWKYSFTDLSKFKAGKEITYTVTESTVEDYSQEIDGYTITNSYTPEETVITVTKHWDDANNQDGKRPENIQVQLTADGESFGEPIELTQENDWTHTWSELPLNSDGEPIKYSVKEITELDGYEVSVNDEDHGNIIITNSYTPEVTEVSGAKTWDDADDQDHKRPDSITVNILANGEQVDTTEVTAENNWRYSFTDLPKFANGAEIEYTVTEDPIENYETTIEGFNITNSYTPETTEVSGAKTWEDANDQDGVRPTSITVNLLADGKEVDSVKVTAENNWKYSFTDLPKYNAGEEIVYTVTENSVEEYTTEIDGTDIINHHKPGKTSATVTKHWDDAINQDGIRPGSIEVQLTADGEAYGDPVELSSENNWTYTWDELDEKAAGEAIEYSVIELTDVPKYETSVNDTDHGNIIITNAYTPEVTEVSGTKIWNDADNQDGIRPESITVNLFANDEFVESSEVTEADNWNYSFSNLPKFEAGEEIIYSITEDHVEDYETIIDGFNITNAYTPEEIEINGMKIWDDADNQEGIRPDSIIVNLLADGEHVQSIKATEADDWKYSFTNMPKFKAGEEIVYTVTENSVKDYSQTVEGFDITNAYTPGQTAITATKQWDDVNNQDGKRPKSIEVQLTADGEAYGDPVELSSENDWTYTWDELDEKAAGETIEYSVVELTDVPEYETTVNDTDHGNIIITNAYTPEITEVTGTKTWNDADNQDGVRPKSITINLLADGELVNSLEVTEKSNWDYSFTNLPKYKDGEEIVYTVTENTVEDYTQEIDGYNINNHFTPGETGVTVTKNWQDANNQDGIRPESIEVQLTADGEAYGDPVELSSENDWTYTWVELDEKAAGETIEYSVVELTDIPEYETSVNDTNHGNIIITNAYTPEVTEVSGKKVWDDENNQEGVRPESITVNLLANSEQVESIEVTEADDWAYSFRNLPKYEAGEEIVYSITEDAVEGYETTINGFTITNTFIAEKDEPVDSSIGSKDKPAAPSKGTLESTDSTTEGSKLPSTASNMFNMLVIGIGLLTLGITVVYYRKNRREQ
ncbi:Cna B-type domain-containing protein [Pseudogracilibacillus sp. SO30301A]|uniref:Cna B-type domain-containing protein n=1 Tax=Pseudogracilibacillus sp. SO30301A TaxID=3098291 RepID=UPI00300E2994